ncbi:hypothetical protein FD19_GL000454 [Lacticaseibacillus thailandensis DSM 22698 = JCM 13996]|uniref:HTH cro/C1-type domain-containing protein n=2 Tax=Lacticaseibacillus thailandensis TaxID=381741 RepID=A0A0R2CDU2_9LACO|nr:hypothetical protein FD19_GL000454 [Lacticaseibacillus thailandensis DSM 22698 = JCM 13996]
MSISSIERHFDWSNGTLSKWKDSAPTDKLQKVATMLNTTIEYLVTGEISKTPQPEALSKNQKLIAYSIDPDISDEERESIIKLVREAMKLRKRM